jgi:hypothetical protein
MIADPLYLIPISHFNLPYYLLFIGKRPSKIRSYCHQSIRMAAPITLEEWLKKDNLYMLCQSVINRSLQ